MSWSPKFANLIKTGFRVDTYILNMPSRWEKERHNPNGNAVTKHRFCQQIFTADWRHMPTVRSTGLGILRNSKKDTRKKERHRRRGCHQQSQKAALLMHSLVSTLASALWIVRQKFPPYPSLVSQWETRYYSRLMPAVTRKKEIAQSGNGHRTVWGFAKNMWL